MEKEYTPQQLPVTGPGLPGQPPAKGWVPAPSPVLNLIGVYDSKKQLWVGLPIEALTEALVLAESKHAIDRLDERDKVEATIPDGSDIGARKTGSFEVKEGEVAFINRLVLVSPAQSDANGEIVKVNARISKWEKPDVRGGDTVNENGRSYWPEGKGTTGVDTYTVDLPAQGELGEELRLFGPAKITLVAELTGAASQAALTASLTPFGRKARRLVE
jgi:hypothetical protein